MPRLRYALAALFLSAAASAQTSDLLFSEYVEGSSFNKAVEVYNGTGAAVDLSAYRVELYSNGSPTVSQSVALSGTLADGDVFVLAHPSADPAVLAVADLTSGSVVNFNGDDALVLRKAGAVVDVIGQVGFDPGAEWGSGLTSTADNTIRRRPGACTADADPSDPFDPAALYDGFATNTFDGIGSHAATCGGASNTAPTFTAAPADQTVPVGAPFSFVYGASDGDGDALTFALVEGPAGAAFDPATGTFSWTPTAADAGLAAVVTVSVTDGAATATTSATLTVVSGAPGAVFFSEYVEGSSSNKAVEVYNGTGDALALDGYRVLVYANGSATPTSQVALSGTLAAGGVYVVANSASGPAVLAAADLTTGSLNFNGDDAVALTDGATTLDVIGQVGLDPGAEWGSGLASTADNTLRRRADSCAGDSDGSDPFDPSAFYVGFAQDTFSGLGAHTATCSTGSNEAPFFTDALGGAVVDGGSTVAFAYAAGDPDGDPVTFALEAGPAGATIDPATGAFSWTTTTTGVYPVTVIVTDGAATTATTAVVGVRGALFPGQAGAELRASLRAAYTPAQTLGYDLGRDVMYGEIDREPDGRVCGVYTGFCVALPDGVDPSAYLAANGINAEHTWPQSMGADDEPGRSDLHNLFPAKDNVNSSRSNKPYAEIPDDQTETWYRLAESRTTVPTSDIDAWSESASGVFEPREVHKGNAARAAVYFYTIYEAVSDQSFLLLQKDALAEWDALDPADAAEVERAYEVSLRQGNVNPFLLDPTLLARAVSDVHPPEPVLVAEARTRPDGTLVTVEGIVTRAEGRFARLQDASAGITVFQTAGPFQTAVGAGGVAEGDSVRVSGTLTTFNGLREVNPSSFEVLSRGHALPDPVTVTLAEVASGGEAYESELVRVVGLTLSTPDGAFAANRSYSVSDGTAPGVLRTPAPGDGLLDGEPVPAGPLSFVGVLSEFNGAYQLQPVLASDVRDETAPAIVLASQDRTLRPPNHRLVTFDVASVVASVTDAGAALDPASVVVTRVTADEAADSAGDGSTSVDVVVGCRSVQVRSERVGGGNGRVYTVFLAASDAAGNVGTASFTVAVPLGRKDQAVDDGAAYAVESGCQPEPPAAGPAASAETVGPPPSAARASTLPSEYELAPAAPNPFRSETDLRFSLPEAGAVRLVVYDVTGREVAVVASGAYEAGTHRASWRPDGLPSGVYFVRLRAGAFEATRRVVLVR